MYEPLARIAVSSLRNSGVSIVGYWLFHSDGYVHQEIKSHPERKEYPERELVPISAYRSDCNDKELFHIVLVFNIVLSASLFPHNSVNGTVLVLVNPLDSLYPYRVYDRNAHPILTYSR